MFFYLLKLSVKRCWKR